MMAPFLIVPTVAPKRFLPLNQLSRVGPKDAVGGVDGMIELEIPHELGYGPTRDPWRADSTQSNLHFVVELFKIGK